MSKYFKYFVYSLLFSPLIGYFSFTYVGFQAVQVLEYSVIVLFSIFLLNLKKPINIPKFLYIYLFYIIYIFIWRLYNGYIDDKGLVKYIFNNYYVYSALLIIIIYNVKITEDNFLKTLMVIRIILIIALLGSLIQLLINPSMFVRPIGWGADEGSIYLSRRPSVFTWVSDNEYGVSVLAYFSLLLSFDSLCKKNFRLILFLILIGMYSILTNGRYVMIGYVLVVSQLLIKQKLNRVIKYLIYFSLALLTGFYIYTNVLGFNLHELAEKRLFAEGSIKNTTRYLAFELFQKYFPQNPIFGTGVHLTDEIRKAAHAGGSSQVHVGYLSHLISYGIVGSILLFFFWFSLARDLYLKAKKTGYFGAFFAFLVFLWGNVAFVDYNIFYPGIIIALIFSQYYYSNYLQIRALSLINSDSAKQQQKELNYQWR